MNDLNRAIFLKINILLFMLTGLVPSAVIVSFTVMYALDALLVSHKSDRSSRRIFKPYILVDRILTA